jgi:hypothetical protein
MVFDVNKMINVKNYHFTDPIRKIIEFKIEGISYLIVLPFEDYFIVINLKENVYCKIIGHKSYVSNAIV